MMLLWQDLYVAPMWWSVSQNDDVLDLPYMNLNAMSPI